MVLIIMSGEGWAAQNLQTSNNTRVNTLLHSHSFNSDWKHQSQILTYNINSESEFKLQISQGNICET